MKIRRRDIGLVLAGCGALLLLALLLWVASPTVAPVERASSDHVWVRKEVVTLTAVGSTGAASGTVSTDRALHGYVYAVYIDYGVAVTTTTDVTLAQASPSLTILTRSNSATDGWFYPTVQQHDNAAATVTAYEKPLVQDQIDVSAAQSTSGTVATVTIYWGP